MSPLLLFLIVAGFYAKAGTLLEAGANILQKTTNDF